MILEIPTKIYSKSHTENVVLNRMRKSVSNALEYSNKAIAASNLSLMELNGIKMPSLFKLILKNARDS